jgi:hypothetical protein
VISRGQPSASDVSGVCVSHASRPWLTATFFELHVTSDTTSMNRPP